MFIKVMRMDGGHSLVNIDDVSRIDEIVQDDTFYHKTTKHLNVYFKNNEFISVAATLAEAELLLDQFL